MSTTLYRKGRCTGRGAAEHLCACTDAVRAMGRRSRGHRGRVDVAQARTHKHAQANANANAYANAYANIRKHAHTRARAQTPTLTNRHKRTRARTHLAVDSRWCGLSLPQLADVANRRARRSSCRKGGKKTANVSFRRVKQLKDGQQTNARYRRRAPLFPGNARAM